MLRRNLLRTRAGHNLRRSKPDLIAAPSLAVRAEATVRISVRFRILRRLKKESSSPMCGLDHPLLRRDFKPAIF